MNNFGAYITPEEAKRLDDETPGGRRKSLRYYKKWSKNNSWCQCGQERVWKWGGTGLCFSCTTGEADASDDYEIL